MGKYLRQMYGRAMLVCGFSFYHGAFRARSAPALPHRSMFLVGPSPPETLDSALAATGLRLFAVDLRTAQPGVVREWLHVPHPMRIIGAIYNESWPSSYVMPIAPDSFDVIFFVNQTSPSRENPPLPRQMETDFSIG
jgi:erythromycin esterase-like protein